MANKPIERDSQVRKAIKDIIKAGKPAQYPIAGHKGLEIRIRPHKNGKDVATDFRHRYTHPVTGKRPYMTLGQYPSFTLADAHEQYRENLSLLGKNTDPIEHRDKKLKGEFQKRNNTLQIYINEWHQLQKDKKLSKSRYITIDNNLEPIIKNMGHLPVADITPIMVIDLIESIPLSYKASRVRATLKSILQRALVKRAIKSSPASDLQGIFIPHKVKHYSALTTPSEYAQILKDIENLPNTDKNYNKEILQLLALTFVRVGDVCSMKWNDVHFEDSQWRFEQGKAIGRSDMMPELVVPLAPQAINILKEMYEKTGDKDYVFYNSRRQLAKHADPKQIAKTLKQPYMNTNGIGENYNGNGYDKVHSPHGFRASAKTLLKRLLKNNILWKDMTELQLGHSTKDRYGSAYDRWDLIQERTEMMSMWADYLDELKAGEFDNVIYSSFKNKQVKHG